MPVSAALSVVAEDSSFTTCCVCSSLWLESVTTRDKRFVFYGLLPLLPNVAPLQRDALICHLMIW